MGQLVKPKVYITGFTEIYEPGVKAYLEDTKQMDFWKDYEEARAQGITGGECLCSMYAKMCYKTLVNDGRNANVSQIRSIRKNLEGTHDTSHGSVFEHCNINFVVTDCSRVYTHEQVRHRVGWAYSQTSGRYCRLDSIDLVWDSILDPVKDLFLRQLSSIEDTVYLAECRLGLRKPPPAYPSAPADVIFGPPQHIYEVFRQQDGTFNRFEDVDKYKDVDKLRDQLRWVPDNSFNFDLRKKLTSAIRRIAPNGQANEIGMTANIRSLRHVVQLRTARFAEVEIRDIYSQIFEQTKVLFPLLWYKARTRLVDGFVEVYGMKSNPYDISPADPTVLEMWSTKSLQDELVRRGELTLTM